MVDIIIVAIIILIVVFGIVNAIKHFRGEGGCCGGGSYKPKKKVLKRIIYKKTFRVDGMHCQHCKNRVEEAVNDIKGVSGSVNLKRGEIVVSYAENVADDIIMSKIEKAGYKAKI